MNIIFHTTTAIGIIATVNDTTSFQAKELSLSNQIKHGLVCFTIGVISHGALDYIPHCYPINSKVDVLVSFLAMLILTFQARRAYRIIVAASFLGCVFPDIIDLLPSILNQYLHLNLPIIQKVFPWHFHKYSGSIYSKDCLVSSINHILVITTVFIVCLVRLTDLKNIFRI